MSHRTGSTMSSLRATALTLLLFLVAALCCRQRSTPTAAATAREPGPSAAGGSSAVRFAGAMRNVMHKGELFGTIAIDTIAPRDYLYGVGPVEYLTGEILVLDGKQYVARIRPDNTVAVGEESGLRAPFFVYANVGAWRPVALPESVTTLVRLEEFLDRSSRDLPRPFAFRLTGKVGRAAFHIMNLPAGTPVRSPEDAHRFDRNVTVAGRTSEIVGFFSTEHQGIFTHHDSRVHLHLITADHALLGHVDSLEFFPGSMQLFLPH